MPSAATETWWRDDAYLDLDLDNIQIITVRYPPRATTFSFSPFAAAADFSLKMSLILIFVTIGFVKVGRPCCCWWDQLQPWEDEEGGRHQVHHSVEHKHSYQDDHEDDVLCIAQYPLSCSHDDHTDIFRSARTSWITFVRPFVRPSARKIWISCIAL